MVTDENPNSSGQLTAGADYAERLQTLETKRWKTLLDVQRPYRWNLRRLDLKRTLDVGCGIGRNLRNLGHDNIRWVDFDVLDDHTKELNLTVERTRSFPLPRAVGRLFTYNEFNLVATVRR